MHLLSLHKYILEFQPRTIVIDPISSLVTIGSRGEVSAMLSRLLDMLKMHQISALITSLTHAQPINYNAMAEEAISSLVDTWIKLRNEERNGNRVRSLYIEKSRGMGHSTEIRDFIITNEGIKILNADSVTQQSGNGAEKIHQFSGNGSKRKR
jgi:circadian clock protein KaiC